MSTERRVPFYHYTSEGGLAGILRDGHIAASDPRNGDALQGPGTYGTNYPPSTRASTVARNNWDAGWRQAMDHGKTDMYIRCEVPESELRQHPGHGGGPRGQILVHPQGIDLSRYPTRFGRVGADPVPYAQTYSPNFYCVDANRCPQPDAAPSYAPGPGPPSPYLGGRSSARRADQDYSGSDQHFHVVGSAVAAALSGHDSDSTEVDHSGCNSWGNSYTTYSDGSYHYDNQDGSAYDRHADGSATYTSPSGDTYEYSGEGGQDDGGHDYDDSRDDGGYEDGGGYYDGGYSDYGDYGDDDY